MRTFPDRWLAAGLVCAALGGCGAKSGDEAITSAKGYLAKNDTAAAIVELKSALAAKPDLAEARFLLGRALLDRDDATGAVLELNKAREFKYPEEQVLPVLARALLNAHEPRKVIALEKSAKLTVPEGIAQLKTATTLALAAVGEGDAAEAMLAAALKASPDHAPALLLRARALTTKGDVPGALTLLDGVLAKAPSDADALALKGELLEFGTRDAAGAAAAYRAALAARPDHLQASAALLSQLLTQNDLAGARAQLEALKKVRAKHPQTLYFDARIASTEGRAKDAYEMSQRLVGMAPENPQVLQLAGIAALQQGRLVEAEHHLGKLVYLAPDYAHGRQLLARALLTAGKPERALAALAPLLEGSSADAPALALAGQARLLLGDAQAAEALLGRAAKLDHKPSRTALAVARFARGETAEGLGQLEAIASSDTGTAADMALISARLNQRDFDGALKAVERLALKQPDSLQPLHLRAQILMRRGDLAGARTSYEKALAKDATYFAAIDGLAALDLRENKPQEARARFEALLKADPRSSAAMGSLAALDEQSGKPKAEVAALLAKAVAANPGDPALRRRLVNYHLSKQDSQLALTAAREAAQALPNSPEVLEALANAQFASGDKSQALASFTKLVGMSPRSADAQLGLARAALLANDAAAAEQAIRNAIEAAPDVPGVLQRAAGLYVLSGRHDDALKLARMLQAKKTQSSLGDELLGDIESSRQAWPAAVAAYRSALKKEPGTQLAQRLFGALNASDKPAARAFALSWSREHPSDVPFLFYVGGVASQAKDFGAAEGYFQQVLKTHPDHALALNNLAWALHEQKKPGALALVERANQLLPDIPTIMDTWALLLADKGEVAKALEIQRRAVALAPDSMALRLTLAKILLKAGDKAAARTELDRLKALGERFADHKEVTALMAQT